MSKRKLTAAAVAVSTILAVSATTAPAMAWDGARTIVQGAYGASGYLACGRGCVKPGMALGGAVYDTGKTFGEWYGRQTGRGGQWIRRQFTD